MTDDQIKKRVWVSLTIKLAGRQGGNFSIVKNNLAVSAIALVTSYRPRNRYLTT